MSYDDRIARAAAGDHEAFAALVGPHERVAYRVAVSITGWQAGAQEAVQNAHLKAYRSLRRFRPGAAFRPWLLQIVANEAHNVRRAERRHEGLAARAAGEHRPAEPGPEETELDRTEADAILRALGTLPEADRLALALRYIARLPDDQAAALAGTTTGAYRVRVMRARRRLVAIVAAAVLALAVAAAPAALRDVFGVDHVTELGPPPAGVAPPILGPSAPLEAAPFLVRTIPSLGEPTATYVRQDVAGGMATVAYGPLLLTQWPAGRLDARVAVVPVDGTADPVELDRVRGLWVEGLARGTLALTGADGKLHHETFEVAGGALLWRDGGRAFLLQGAGSRATAVRLARGVR